MKKINKTISIVLLMVMFVGLAPNISFAQAKGATVKLLTSEEMEFIVGGGGGDNNKTKPPVDGKPPDEFEHPPQDGNPLGDWEPAGKTYKMEFGLRGHVDGIVNSSHTNTYSMTHKKYLTVRNFVRTSGNVNVKLLFNLEGVYEYEKTVTDEYEYLLYAEPREMFNLFYDEVIDVNTYKAYEPVIGRYGMMDKVLRTYTIKTCESFMYYPVWTPLAPDYEFELPEGIY